MSTLKPFQSVSLRLWMIFGLISIAANSSFAQLLVDNSLTEEELAQSLVGGGVTVSNVNLTCPNNAFGRFIGVGTGLGIDSGLILTSGTIFDAPGPNGDSGAGIDNAGPGDALLNALSSAPTFNACILEFDVVPLSDTLAFNYVFGSEEYLEFVFAGYNDIFAFGISGPGITGIENMALIPGTMTPVSIDNVNDVSFPEYYVDNGDGFTAPYSVDPFYIQYDGYTTVLQAKRAVIPCNTYTLRLAIADAGDEILDSGVFIEAGSLTSFGVSLSSSTSVGFGFENAVEGCVDGIITFTRDLVDTSSLTVDYIISGTAVNGLDYAAVGSSIVIPPSTASADLVIAPIVDALPEGIETVTIYLLSECSAEYIDSVTLGIQDEILLDLNVPSDTVICPGASIALLATGGIFYTWSPVESLDDPGIPNPVASPDNTTTYVVATSVGTCTASADVTIGVSPELVPDAGADLAICAGESVGLNASGGLLYAWSPAAGLSDTASANPMASPTSTTVYTLLVTDAAGCTATDELTLTVNPLPDAQSAPDTLVCPGTVIQLSASGGVLYTWTPETGLDDPGSASPLLTVNEPGIYTVLVTDANGCQKEASISIDVEPFPTVDAGLDTLVFFGESIQLDGSGSGSLEWMPAGGLSSTTIGDPLATPSNTTLYYLTATSPIGCQSIDSVLITVIFDPIVELPTAFSPNGDGVNDLFGVIVRGPVEVQAYRIYNRWGEVVFESNSINGGWDGTVNGKDQEIGAYVVHFSGVDPNGVAIERHGTLHLVR